jgi:hypothetical protein
LRALLGADNPAGTRPFAGSFYKKSIDWVVFARPPARSKCGTGIACPRWFTKRSPIAERLSMRAFERTALAREARVRSLAEALSSVIN